jgi:hypothetical protein
MKQIILTEKVKIQTADPKANASEFLFFPTAQNILKFIANPQTAHLPVRQAGLVFAETLANAQKTKRAIFC